MDNMHLTNKERERVILVGIDTYHSDLVHNFLELEELALTAGVEVLDKFHQSRDRAHPTTYLGKGKLEELKDFISLHNATGIICDDELTSNQLSNMSDVLDIKVMDRTMLILDIFAKRAFSAEGKDQVELAQLKYNSSRLIGLGKSLSRQSGSLGGSGGIASKGPGEKKLEMDRRHIRRRIDELESELKNIKRFRQTQRERREQNESIVVSLVGYTNAGKSTLMNYITDADVLAEDKLFATLDTTTRKLTLSNNQEVLCTDTVGFIQKLPHTLVRAFNATLEELQFANILLHVVDISNPYYQNQMEVVYKTLEELEVKDKPIITIFNKIDLTNNKKLLYIDPRANKTVNISAKDGKGIGNLILAIEEVIASFRKEIEILLPFEEGTLLNEIHKNTQILEEDYRENGIYFKIIANDIIYNKVEKFILK